MLVQIGTPESVYVVDEGELGIDLSVFGVFGSLKVTSFLLIFTWWSPIHFCIYYILNVFISNRDSFFQYFPRAINECGMMWFTSKNKKQ